MSTKFRVIPQYLKKKLKKDLCKTPDSSFISYTSYRVVAALHLVLGHPVGGAVAAGEAVGGGDGRDGPLHQSELVMSSRDTSQPITAHLQPGLGPHLHVGPGRHHPGRRDHGNTGEISEVVGLKQFNSSLYLG